MISGIQQIPGKSLILISIFYQSMGDGVSGNRGLNARALVAAEFKHVLALALIPAPPMEEKIALVAEMRPDLVEPTLAQVNVSANMWSLGKILIVVMLLFDKILKNGRSKGHSDNHYGVSELYVSPTVLIHSFIHHHHRAFSFSTTYYCKERKFHSRISFTGSEHRSVLSNHQIKKNNNINNKKTNKRKEA